MTEKNPFYYCLNPCFNMWRQWPLYGSKWQKEERNNWRLIQEDTVRRYINSSQDNTNIKTYHVTALFR